MFIVVLFEIVLSWRLFKCLLMLKWIYCSKFIKENIVCIVVSIIIICNNINEFYEYYVECRKLDIKEFILNEFI